MVGILQFVECTAGKYDQRCDLDCPTKCKDRMCVQTTGTCIDCVPGKHGSACDDACPMNCDVCVRETGHCIGCDSGYHGDICGIQCRDNCTQCQQNDGSCTACAPGYYGDICADSCGHCQESGCGKDTGSCGTPCLSGWTGERCDIKVIKEVETSSPIALIGLGVGAGVVIIAMAIVIIVLVRRRATRRGGDGRHLAMTDTVSTRHVLSVDKDCPYAEIDNPPKLQPDENYQELGPRPVEPSHVYLTTMGTGSPT